MKYKKIAMMLASAMLMAFPGAAAAAETDNEQIPVLAGEGENADELLSDFALEPSSEEAAETPEDQQTQDSTSKPKEDKNSGASLEDVKGLIEGAGEDTISRDLSDGLSWDELQEEEGPESGSAVKIPGFTVDPTKYPAANITVNTRRAYWYLRDELQLSHAAACGVLANIQLESNFRPLAIGDSGTSFGICQWHLGRLSALMNYCNQSGRDYHTLEGQLAYLKYELTGGYRGVLEGLLGVENTPDGAYDAGYLFCMGFEKPDQTLLRSQRRGNLAQNEYFGRTFERPLIEDNEPEDPYVWLRALKDEVKKKARSIHMDGITDADDFQAGTR